MIRGLLTQPLTSTLCLQEFRRARVAASMAAAQQRQQHHREAELDDAAEVARVLAAKSHLECLQLRAGASHSDVKGKYHELARLLHPDKCKVCCGTG